MTNESTLLIKKRKKPTVQLTSLLDLLFIMIFISLIQSKERPLISQPQAQAEVTKEVQETKPVNLPITAVFHFYATSQNPRIPTGTFAMEGTFNTDSRQLRLGGVSWINRPDGYDMIPLNGKIASSGMELTGRIEFHGCEEFTLRRTSQISNSAIAGKWEGKYVCSQGETGLTLTIQ